jgi:O-antigen/teichoic acid export membrane protein
MDESPNPAAADPQAPLLRRRANVALAVLAGRTVVLQLTTLAGQVALARYLEPHDFGVYAVIRFALSFFVFFGDVGLGGGLIQKKDAPTEAEVSSVFTLQVLLSLGIVTVVWLGAGLVDHIWTDLPTSGPWLLRILALDLFLTALRTIPSILMERSLQFMKLAGLDVTLGLAFYVTAITLARLHFGSNALVIAVVVQGALGAVLAFALHPFRPRLTLNRAALRPLVKFGIPFQLFQVIGFLNGAVTPIYAGAALGVRSLGFINWAQDTAYFPLKAVEIVGRVGFPLYSRLQSDPRALGESFGRAVHLCAIATAFFVGLAFSMGANVIHVVFTDKWMPALPLLYIYAGAISIGFYTPVISAALNATGRPGLLLRLACIWVALAWIVVPLTTPRWGVQGYAYGYCFHVVLGNIMMMALTPRLVPHARLFRRLVGPACGGVLVYLTGHFCLTDWAMTPWRFAAAVAALLLLHVGFLLLVDFRGVRSSLSLLPKDSELTNS